MASWLDGGEVWNPVVGCTPVSPGCDNCYSARLCASRLRHMPDYKGLAYWSGTPTARRAHWTSKVRLLPHKLEQPLRWRKPRKVFVVDKGDLFHPDVPFQYVAAVYGIMAAAPQHTFLVLTKRPEMMVAWYRWLELAQHADSAPRSCTHHSSHRRRHRSTHTLHLWRANDTCKGYAAPPTYGPQTLTPWPLPNVWIGVTAEDQQRANERIPLLLQVPAAVRWVSYEPGLGHLKSGLKARLDWIVIGCESGPKARPFELAWAESIIAQCKAAGVPVFTKQLRSGNGELLKSAQLAARHWPVQYPEDDRR